MLNKNFTGTWEIPDNLDTTNFDFTWKPDRYDPPFIHQFGTQWQKTGGPRYIVEGATDIKYHDHQHAVALVNPINRCWRGVPNIEFDYSWHPDATEPPFIYQFGTQWQKTGGPRYVVKGATVVKFIDSPRATALSCRDNWTQLYPIDEATFDYSWHPDATEPPYIYKFGTQYHELTTFPVIEYRVADAVAPKFIDAVTAKLIPDRSRWIIPPNIDDSSFDYGWMPLPDEEPYIYQFGTQWQKTGGPRYVVEGATEVKYIDTQRVKALPCRDNWTILQNADVSQFDLSWHPDSTDGDYIYAFGNQWRTAEEEPTVLYKVNDATEYKYIDIQVAKLCHDPLDIVFISNGETGENERYDELCRVAGRDVKWVHGVEGRENALRKAATLSTTDWVLVFPGKLMVNPEFDFNWQPNRYHDPKHYIFYATNPVNGLQYGHMAAVAYNRELVLDTVDYGLDFTMSKPHDIVPIYSGIAQFNSDALMTWRTAFREAIKLSVALADGDVESGRRLNFWLNIAYGDYREYSLRGAREGLHYYHETRGDHAKLQQTFSWKWLDERFQQRSQKL